MKDEYILMISQVPRIVSVINERWPIFRVDSAIQKRKDQIIEEEIFDIGKELGLKKRRALRDILNSDRENEMEYGFINNQFSESKNPQYNPDTWLTINLTKKKCECSN